MQAPTKYELVINLKTAKRCRKDRPARSETAGFEQRRKLWEALSAFVSKQGGWVVSAPGNRQMRIEIALGSSLPAKLSELGYDPIHCGTTTRITGTGSVETITAHSTTGQPSIRQHPGFQNVDVIEITLGG